MAQCRALQEQYLNLLPFDITHCDLVLVHLVVSAQYVQLNELWYSFSYFHLLILHTVGLVVYG